MATGLTAAETVWLQVVATTLVAGSCSLIIAWWRLRPAGSLFHIFAFAAIASIPNQPPLWQGMLVGVLTVVFALLLGISSRVVRSRRTPWMPAAAAALKPAERRRPGSKVSLTSWRRAWLERCWGQGRAGLGFGHNYWAMVAAVVPLVGRTTRHRVSRGRQRIVGTAPGLVLLAAILLQPVPWQTVLVIAACQFGAEMFIARQYVLAQIFVTPLSLTSTLLVAPLPPGRRWDGSPSPSSGAASSWWARRCCSAWTGAICGCPAWSWYSSAPSRPPPR